MNECSLLIVSCVMLVMKGTYCQVERVDRCKTLAVSSLDLLVSLVQLKESFWFETHYCGRENHRKLICECCEFSTVINGFVVLLSLSGFISSLPKTSVGHGSLVLYWVWISNSNLAVPHLGRYHRVNSAHTNQSLPENSESITYVLPLYVNLLL